MLISRTVIFLTLTAAAVVAADAASPEYPEMPHLDPLRNSEVADCSACHVDETISLRNKFGPALEADESTNTALPGTESPDRFIVRTASAGEAEIHFVDPDGTSLILEIGGERFLVDASSRRVTSLELPPAPPEPSDVLFEAMASNGESPAVASPPAEPARPALQAAIPGDAATREGVVFGSRVVNVPNAKPVPDGGVEFLIGHRFNRDLFQSGSAADLFGFDSFAQVTFGVDVGVTDRLSLSAMRSNDPFHPGGTIELNSAFQVSNQGDTVPLSTQLRLGIDGRDNFSEQYAPYLQFVATHTVADRLSLVLAPSVAFNTRNDSSSTPPNLMFGAEHDYTASLGIGVGLRLLPSVSVVAEYVPRLAGFRGEIDDEASMSFGVQKSTFRHTFEFVVSNTRPMVTSQYIVNATDSFKVGFNIYRRLR